MKHAVKTRTRQQTTARADKIVGIIDHALTQIFGKEATRVIYRFLENSYSLRRDELADRIDVFTKALEEFLNTGAYVVERKILEDIYSNHSSLRKIELEKMQPDSDFADRILLLAKEL